MLFVIGEPVARINNALTARLNGLSGANALLLGAIPGFMCSFDLGGPVNKASYAFCLGAMANGVYGPYAIFASVKMVSAFTVTASTMLAPNLFKQFEIETGKSTAAGAGGHHRRSNSDGYRGSVAGHRLICSGVNGDRSDCRGDGDWAIHPGRGHFLSSYCMMPGWVA